VIAGTGVVAVCYAAWEIGQWLERRRRATKQ